MIGNSLFDIRAWFKNSLFRVTASTTHRHSRMLLAGIQGLRRAGFPPEACGNDETGVTQL
jgi:hypothetical protein